MSRFKALTTLALAAGSASSALAFNPQAGDWLKEVDSDLRVMTWNVEDGICSSNNKTNGTNNWNAIVRIIAAFEPDIIIFQETGDNTGNGTGGGVDSVNALRSTFLLLINGGNDVFNGSTPVTSYVQMLEPHLDYNIFVSSNSDGFNRNVILSRFPFADLNNDNGNVSQYSDITVFGDLYAPGFSGGIRGYQFAEIDLPDDIYGGDVVIGNGHLKAGSSTSDRNQRITASQNIAYFIDYFYNGAGTGTPDPRNRIQFDNPDTVILDDNTPVIWGGDINNNPGNTTPEGWMRRATSSANDGTDRDRSESSRENAVNPFDGNSGTLGNSKLDYLFYQDSIATIRNQFIFNSNTTQRAAFPDEIEGFSAFPQFMSSVAADHRPVVVDFILPEPIVVIEPCPGDTNQDNMTDIEDLLLVLREFGSTAGPGDVDSSGTVDIEDLLLVLREFGCDNSQL